MSEVIAALVAAAVAIVGALSSFIVSQIQAQKNKKELDGIREIIKDSDSVYYITCPNCGTKICLKNAEIKKED